MTNAGFSRLVLWNIVRRTAFSLVLCYVMTTLTMQPAHGQTYTALHTFTGPDGANPHAGVTPDASGNLYGTTYEGGTHNRVCGNGCGTVFKLTHKNSGWVLTTLYSFQGGFDGAAPTARVVWGPDGALYGTTSGSLGNFGTVFRLTPPAAICHAVSCPWTETVIYRFTGGVDGDQPGYGDLIFDQAGNIYGTTVQGGAHQQGTVFKLTRFDTVWLESVLYSFAGPSDGAYPFGGLVFDNAGNLYGTTTYGGVPTQGFSQGLGAIFQLTPSGSGWTESVLWRFQDELDGAFPYAALTFDSSGTAYGTASSGGGGLCNILDVAGCGTIFEGFGTGIYSFSGSQQGLYTPYGPAAPLTSDAAGNLYGTTYQDGANNDGSVFKLTHGDSGWTYASLHDFGNNDGAFPLSNVVFDSSGNMFGTALGGSSGGVVWEITP